MWPGLGASRRSETRGLPTEQARQVRVLADAYGLSGDQRRRLPAAIEDRLVRNERFWRERADQQHPGHAGPRAAEVLAWTGRKPPTSHLVEGLFAAVMRRPAYGV
jgi:hypothetical protein